MKTPLHKAIEEFERLKSKASAIRDIVYLDGVLSILDRYELEEKQFAKECFEAGNTLAMPDFDDFYKQYEE